MVDINRRYRSCAIFCCVHGSKNNGRALIPWELLQKEYGLYWETYTHELTFKGIIRNTVDYCYLSDLWANMTQAERMSKIEEIYPRIR